MIRLRILGIVWMIAALVVCLIAVPAAGLAQDVGDLSAGIGLIFLSGVAAIIGAVLLVADPDRRFRRASLAISVLWIVGSIFTILPSDFAVDRWVVGGIPAAIGVFTALLNLLARRRRLESRPSALGAAEVDEPPP
jgi:hypothetical protein